VIRVGIADDQDLVRTGLGMVLRTHGCDVVGDAANGREAVALAAREAPDVLLMDIRMPVLDGIAATAEIVRSGSPTRVLVLTTYDIDEYVYGALRSGAAGFLLKTTPPDRLVAGIHVVAGGEALLAPVVTRRLIEEHVRRPPPVAGVPDAVRALTESELRVLRQMAAGLSNVEIAQRLFVSEATVKTHINHLLAKLGLSTRVQAVVAAYECGLVQPGHASLLEGA
jgi:DNA-binding NarL/FixJ family response regulator